MNKQASSRLAINVGLLSFAVVLVLGTLSYPFYWDNVVQLAVPANWFYEHGFSSIYLPDDISTGHPPFVGMYFAMLWKIFGRSLWVTHIGMLPFVFGLLYQLHHFIRNIGIKEQLKVLLILGFIIIDATFLAQLSLITFDIVQLFFFFLCLNFILTKRNIPFALSYMVLTVISLRAAMMAGGLVLFQLLFDQFHWHQKFKVRNYLKFLPGILSLFLFLIFFKINKGWMIHNTVSQAWSDSSSFASGSQAIRNIAVFGWRLVDFGRIGIFLFFGIFLFKLLLSRKIENPPIKALLLLIISQFCIFFPIIVAYQNPFGHRYLLPIILPIIILTIHWMYDKLRFSPIWLAMVFVVSLSGHFWLYPPQISQGWDATTLHWKYFKVVDKMNTFIAEQNIDKKEVATFFPNKASSFISYLTSDKADEYKGTPLKSKYMLYSNAFNVEDEIIEAVTTDNSDWEEIQVFSANKIFIALYRKRTKNQK